MWGAPPAGPLSWGCGAQSPPAPRPPADLSRAVSAAGRPGAGSEFRGSGRWGEGLGELLRGVVSSRRWLGGVERRG